jgi:hypothetical protein
MHLLASILLATVAAADPLSVSGAVMDEQGNPIPEARVFLEPGLALRLVEGDVSPEGTFHFKGLRPGLVGVVALADGRMIGGASVEVGVDEPVTGVEIRLGAAQTLAGKVMDPRGHPIQNATLSGLLLQGDEPIGIPLRKLSAFGFEIPSTNDAGEFSFNRVPDGTLALKFTHPEFAQETVSDILSGSTDVKATMDPGVMVQGAVRARGSQLPVARAALLVAGPGSERSTAIAVTDTRGHFAIKLKPGRYACQASSAQYRSPGWESMNITGRQIVQEVTLYVAGSGSVRGRVRDARSGDPIANVRLSVSAFENTVDVKSSGPKGGFSLMASEGPNVVRVLEAPGYRTDGILTWKVDVKQGQAVEVPDIWLASIPPFQLHVVDSAGAGIAGAVVTMLRPDQNRWRETDANGMLSLDVVTLPSTGRIVGMVEHPNENLGAVFALDVTQGGPGRVQLFPMSSVRGSVHSANGKPLAGIVVGGAFQADDASDPILLWKTLSRSDGSFAWQNVIPHLALVCVASDGEEGYAYSIPFNLEPGSTRDVGRVVLESTQKAESMRGDRVDWGRFQQVGGPDLPEDFKGPALVIFAGADEARPIVDALEAADRILKDDSVTMIAVMTDGARVENAGIAVVSGIAPGAAQTYLIDGMGEVVLETSGMPPLAALRHLSGGTAFE